MHIYIYIYIYIYMWSGYRITLVVYTSGLFWDLVPRSQNKPPVNSLFSNHF